MKTDKTKAPPKKTPVAISRAEMLEQGKSLRPDKPLEHNRLLHRKRRDPIEILERTNEDRMQRLVPLRHARMLASPFAFYRGGAAIMATDLSHTPSSGILVQACGDCHVMNFGGFATPERNIVLDINDFDETLQAPWEWDVKRLAASLALAASAFGHSGNAGQQIAFAMAKGYREQMRMFAQQSVMDVWYSRLDVQHFIDQAQNEAQRRQRQKVVEDAKRKSSPEVLASKLTEVRDGVLRFKDMPPLLYHDAAFGVDARVHKALEEYRKSLAPERQMLLKHFTLVDVAVKVVGIGSVGTRCLIMLLVGSDMDVLILQSKEARSSVLEPFCGQSPFPNHGERVVVGQRIMQSASDIFLGWTKSEEGRHYYVRQLRDVKLSPNPEIWDKATFQRIATGTGQILARAHARSGESPAIAGYLGKSEKFETAISGFGIAYAEQTEQDFELFVKACKSQRLATESKL